MSVLRFILPWWLMLHSTGANPPTGLSATQVGPTSIRVSWTAPVSGATVTGYRISYSGGTDQGSVDVGASATDHTITIPQPQSRLIYTISIITLSSSFQSSMPGPIMVTVGKLCCQFNPRYALFSCVVGYYCPLCYTFRHTTHYHYCNTWSIRLHLVSSPGISKHM